MAKPIIIGLNVGAMGTSPTGRGFFNSKDRTFCYIPIEETEDQRIKFTFKDLNNTCINESLDYPCHYDPEFKTCTYGHIRRGFGDSILYKTNVKNNRVYILFYSTLDIDNKKEDWDVFAIGYFEVDKIVDARKLTDEQIFSLKDFQNNAHLRRKNPIVELLIKGTEKSRLFKEAIPFLEFQHLITTTTNKEISRVGPWYRWVYYSENQKLLEL